MHVTYSYLTQSGYLYDRNIFRHPPTPPPLSLLSLSLVEGSTAGRYDDSIIMFSRSSTDSRRNIFTRCEHNVRFVDVCMATSKKEREREEGGGGVVCVAID